MQKIASFLIRKHGLDDSFYIANMSVLQRKIKEWKEKLPYIRPFYAIKCNPDYEMMKLMNNEGIGYDCASAFELKKALGVDSNPRNIIFAHPVKKIDDMKYASKMGVRYTTFDSLSEVEKIKKHYPEAMALLRLKINNPSARVQLGLKYGVDENEYKDIINFAKDLNINIAGTCFHVGSASKDPRVFSHGVEFSRKVFDYARSKGFINMNIVDIGGGFTSENFKECSKEIDNSLNKYFPSIFDNSGSIKCIAEPGRYFAEDVFTFFTPVLGHRERGNKKEYWISDGLYGSFNCILYDKQEPNFHVLRNPLHEKYTTNIDEKKYKTCIQGVTCDTLDKVCDDIELPLLRNGDFIQVNNFGAYTLSGAKDFNGINMSSPKIFYVTDDFI